ncbi:MAG: hypothetical protein COV47_00450 [Candidatus Diapherotrites archaeon CG11_big_fil_rev_8_21_14_0_20_37_9]|nr:MAG: hypothetical protein COV47_00450 [Candidatus Diapherotrites archaeon CG11_big_fil_rev_8_21_14_0_20_37_9]
MKQEFLFLLIVFCLFPVLTSGATISGTLFEWYTLEPLNNTIVEIDTIPKQIDVTTNGIYSFNVTETGTYNLKAQYFENNLLKYEASEIVEVKGDGNFTIDMILLPNLEENEYLFEDIDNIELTTEDKQALESSEQGNLDIAQAGIIAIIVLVFAALFFIGPKFITKKITGLETEHISVEKKYSNKNETEKISDEANELTEIIKRYGGRMTQKDIRDKVDYGEAKTSLIIAELENTGKIKKFRKGRGNIIILKK